MNMFDEAKSFEVMMRSRGLSQSEVARMLGVSQSYVANKLRLLQLDEKIQEKIASAGLTERHARALLRLEEGRRADALQIITERALTVNQSEALIDFMRCAELPKQIGKADRLRGVDIFLLGLKDSLAALSSIGVKSHQKISYSDNKIVVAISIENE